MLNLISIIGALLYALAKTADSLAMLIIARAVSGLSVLMVCSVLFLEPIATKITPFAVFGTNIVYNSKHVEGEANKRFVSPSSSRLSWRGSR